MQGLFKNDFPGLMFQNFLGLDGKPVGPGIPGRYVLEQIYGMTTRRGKWGDLSCHVRRARVEIEISFRNFKRCKILLRHPRVILIYSCLQEKYYSSTNTFDVPKQCGY
jgi:hypothetical protein